MSNTIDELNFLGRFATIDEVYAAYPSGGVPGNYVIVGSTVMYWDERLMVWVEQEGGAGGDYTVDGTLTADELVLKDGFRTSDYRYDTQGSALRKESGEWVLSVDDIRVRNSDHFKGQSAFRMYVFTRSESQPDTPNGGIYSNPLPSGIIWKESVPSGNNPIWMSSRTYTSDGQPPQSEWSTPVKLVDGENFDIEFSPSSTTSVPDPPSSSNLGILWFDPSRNPNADWQSMNWMATRIKNQGTWGQWVITLIKGARGADGDGYENVFYRTKLKIAPTAVIDQSQFQNDNYCPAVGNRADCNGATSIGEENFSDDPMGVEKEWPYEWVMQRRKRGGVWQSFSTPAVLWATYSEGHDVTISDDGYWVIDGEKTDKKAVPSDGAVATIRGRVDVYADAEKESQDQTSLQSYPITQNIEVGDCWVVEDGEKDGESVAGHLFLYIGGSNESWEDDWHDLGEFKGEKGNDGHSQYLYLAWAADVKFYNTEPPTFKSVDGFTTDPGTGQGLAWMGILVSNTEIATVTVNIAGQFKWNYLAGRDGKDYEHVYIRTKVLSAPTIHELPDQTEGYQTDEHRPQVGNYITYQSTDIDGNTFFDDPKGVGTDEDTGVFWPYEWVSRREKTNGHWGAFQSPAILHNNWAEKGESAVTIKAYPPLFTVNTPSNGQLSSLQALTLKCRLFDGNTEVAQTSTTDWSLNYSNSSQATISNATIENGAVKWVITMEAHMTLTDGILTVTKTHNGKTLTELVPVSVIADGAEGRKVTQVDTYYLLTTMYQGVSVNTQGWVANTYQEPTELLPYLWRYTKYTFSTGSPTTTPCELIAVYSSKSNPNLLADTGFIDGLHMSAWRKKGHLEITNPSNPTVLDGESAFYIGSNSQLKKDGHNSYVGFEKSASQEPNPNDYISLLIQDLYHPSQGIARVAPGTWYTLSFWLKSTSNFALNSKLDVRIAGGYTPTGGNYTYAELIDLTDSVYIDGVATQTSANNTKFQATDAWVKHTFTFKTTGAFAPAGDDAGNIRFSLRFQMSITTSWQEVMVCMPKLEVGKVATAYMEMLDSLNPTPRTSVWTPGKQYYQGMTGEPYLDIVSYGNLWYRCLLTHVSTNDITPSNAGYWQPAADYRFVATDLLLAERGVINLLASNVINLFDVSRNKTASINEDGHGSYCIYYSNGRKKMEFCYDGYIYYYKNEEGSPWKWRLGYGGDILTGNEDDMQPVYLTKLTSGLSTLFGSSTTWSQTEYWQFHAGLNSGNLQHNGKIYSQEFNPVSEDLDDRYPIADGYYTPDAAPKKVNLMYMTLVYEVEGGIIVGKYNLYSDGSDASNNISRPITDTEEEDSANSGSSSGSSGGAGNPTNPGGGGTNQGGVMG